MSRLRAITARFGVGRKRNAEDIHTQAEVAAAAPATAHEQSGPGADNGDNSAASNAPSLAEFEAHGSALREGGQPTAPEAAPAPDASPGPQGER